MNTSPSPQPAETETAALLKIGGLGLALPQREVSAIEPAADVGVSDDAQPFSVGWISHAGKHWPVYCLSPELSLLIVVPDECRDCVVLPWRTGFIGIVCEGAGTCEVSAAQRHELPPAMRKPDTPVLSLIALEDGEVACETNAEQLAFYISRLTGS